MSIADVLLKQLKIDPDEIQRQIAATAQGFNMTVAHFTAQLNRIEKNQQTLLEHFNLSGVDVIAIDGKPQ